MKKLILFIITILINGNLYSQKTNDTELYKYIKEIEDISNFTEVLAGIQAKHTTKITYNETLNTLTIDELNVMGNLYYDRRITKIYLDDIIRNQTEYGIDKIIDDKYSVTILIHSKHKSIETKSLSYEKGKKHLAVTEKKYNNKVLITTNGNNVSKYVADKYISAWKKLLNHIVK